MYPSLPKSFLPLNPCAPGLQPCGKQSGDQSWSCFYTRTTGIWQPVWLEAVGSSFVENLSVVPDPDHSRVLIEGFKEEQVKWNSADIRFTTRGRTLYAFALGWPEDNRLVVRSLATAAGKITGLLQHKAR